MTLVDGKELLQIIGTGLLGEAPPRLWSAPPVPALRGGDGADRTPRVGAGRDFWGYSTFPACRGTTSISDEVPAAL
jgi:hypothetical protein